ncbi:hypothetical protein LAZ67_9001762 [Cordylochernes scorpioides]|uniref:Reverse transcriptase Ty1/copia-type domain-containing protein n=1 Tax=Cordylochernes scorpioides TaxID=51811 RepID=A0ABY6KTA3_9ARAC|nr:hypothetical protein LAZ67_9001762 [Cordylochernes scorpioides]
MKKVIPQQKDVQTAFLYGDLEEEIFMLQPPGYEKGNNKICYLMKSIYGLKQASRMWNKKLDELLTNAGMKQSANDPCLYYCNFRNHFLYLGIHVDDILSVGSGDDFEENIWRRIKREIDITDLGAAKNFLGMEFEYRDDSIFINQKKYIEEILETYNLRDCNPSKTPLCISTNYDLFENSKSIDQNYYQEIVGRLIYIATRTRPDICYAISNMSRFNKDPREVHMNGLKRILRYLKGTMNYELIYSRGDSSIVTYTDASWDRTADARSYSGFVIEMGNNLLNWKKSELEALSEGIKELIWTRNIIGEIKIDLKDRITVYCDSQNAISMIKSKNMKASTKYLNGKCHFIRQIVEDEEIKVLHVPSEEMKADHLTKSVDAVKIKNCLSVYYSTFQRFHNAVGIKLRHSTAYYPGCNRKIERLHRTFKTAIHAHNNIKWTEKLETVLLGLHAAIHKNINHSLARETEVFVHKDLKTCSHVFMKTDRVKKPLEPPYERPFPILARIDNQSEERNEIILIYLLRPAYLLADSDNLTSVHPPAARLIVSRATPSTSSKKDPDPPDVKKYTEFQGTGSAPT